MDFYINVYDFGAVGDGVKDDTKAFRKAIDRAYITGENIVVPPGKFLCGELLIKPNICIKSEPTWGYRYEDCGRSVIVQKDISQRCILNITHASGATVDGLSLQGIGQGNCRGILADSDDFNTKEDSYRIQNCRIMGFGGNGIELNKVWCFSIRHSMIGGCGGDGLRIFGWDGFILDNWLSGNAGCGFAGECANASVTMTGNRIEWNGKCGIHISHGNNYNITGNYIDRSGGAAIKIENGSYEITASGNILYRSGKCSDNGEDNCHVIIRDSEDIIFTSNAMRIGRDDGNSGIISPQYAVILKNLKNSVILGNTLEAVINLIKDDGMHENTIIRDNVGKTTNLNRE